MFLRKRDCLVARLQVGEEEEEDEDEDEEKEVGGTYVCGRSIFMMPPRAVESLSHM